jgi:hypothetical protein
VFAGPFDLRTATGDEINAPLVGVVSSLVSLAHHREVHGAAERTPSGERATRRHVGVVGVGVDGEGDPGSVVKESHVQVRDFGAVALTKLPTSRAKSSAPSNPL